MIVMIFEFEVRPHELEAYLHESAELRPHLAAIDGFISIERFASQAMDGRYVAIGYFESEEAVAEWRNLHPHRRAQTLGRSRFFSSYRLVMAQALRDYTHDRREQAPNDSKPQTGNRNV